MRKFFCILAAVFSLAMTGWSDDSTNAPKTEIENFEAQTDAVIVKGFGRAGSLTTEAGIISVRLKESINVSTSRKLYGMAIEIAAGQRREFFVVDYDELDPLLNGLDYLGKINYDASALPSFDAAFTTRSGLKIVAYSQVRQGGIHAYLQFGDSQRIPFASDQLAQFQNLIAQAKTSLDGLKNK